jgi:hypothetical protein
MPNQLRNHGKKRSRIYKMKIGILIILGSKKFDFKIERKEV